MDDQVNIQQTQMMKNTQLVLKNTQLVLKSTQGGDGGMCL